MIAVDDFTAQGQAFEAFSLMGFRCYFVANDPSLGEGVSFPKLLSRVADEPGLTFYCHSKGASYPSGHISQQWADVMFHLCLDYPELVEKTLQTHAIAGAFKRVEQRMNVDWHYSGTFFWFHRFPYGMPLTNDRNCVERWPSENFHVDNAGDLGLADCRNLYDEINWRSWITRRFQKEILWDAQRKALRVRRDGLPPTAFQPLQEIYAE